MAPAHAADGGHARTDERASDIDDFTAYRISRSDGHIRAGFTTLGLSDLDAGDVLVRFGFYPVLHRAHPYSLRDIEAMTARSQLPPGSRW